MLSHSFLKDIFFWFVTKCQLPEDNGKIYKNYYFQWHSMYQRKHCDGLKFNLTNKPNNCQKKSIPTSVSKGVCKWIGVKQFYGERAYVNYIHKSVQQWIEHFWINRLLLNIKKHHELSHNLSCNFKVHWVRKSLMTKCYH